MNIIQAGICLIAFAVAALAPQQGSGILFVQEQTQNGKVSTSRVQIDRNHMRADTGAETGIVLFDGTEQVMRIIQPEKKTYMELTKAEAERLGGQMNQVMAQLQDQLKNLPPEQRRQVEQMMQGRGGLPSATTPSVQYRRTGMDKVGQWTCAKYEGHEGDRKVSELCTVEPTAFSLTAADFEVSRQLAEFMKGLVPQLAESMMTLGRTETQGFSGIPVRRITFQNGAVNTVSEVKEVSRQNFPADTFALPAGLTKQQFGAGYLGQTPLR